MNNQEIADNSGCIEREVEWFTHLLTTRMEAHAKEADINDIFALCPAPKVYKEGSPYENIIHHLNLQEHDRLILILALIPHIKPGALDSFFITNQSLGRCFTEFGGIVGKGHGGFLPTAETAMFLLTGDAIKQRLNNYPLFNTEAPLFSSGVLLLNQPSENEPILSAGLILSTEYREKILGNGEYTPKFGANFPAQVLTTLFEWDDLVLNTVTHHAIDDILTWQEHETTLMQDWELFKQIKKGYRCLFYGPPGTGKTLTACLLSKSMNIPLYRVDLSRVVSKYIGETEKNLAGLFDYAETHKCILFFDEGDALFGSRSESNTANDRAANQQIAYLLQRIEDFSSIVILATNLRDNLDDAFSRRFQSEIYFDIPDQDSRLKLWQDNFENRAFELADDVDLQRLAADYPISGGSIVNILRYACLKAVKRQPPKIQNTDLMIGIKNELKKEGKTFPKPSLN